MKSRCLICFFLVSIFGQSQIFTPDTNAYKSFIQIDFDVSYENGAFGNEFIDAIFSDEFIPLELRQKNLDQMDLKNSFGLNFIQNNEVYLGNIHPIKKRKRYGLKLGFDWRFSIFGEHSDDFMTLVFRGNEPFINTAANAAKTEINLYNHQRLKFGLYDRNTHSFLNLAIGKGTRLTQAIFDQASLISNENATSLEFDWNGIYRNQDQNNWTDFNGTSLSLDAKYFFINRPNETRKFLNIMSLELNHFGLMQWRNVSETQIDTNFTFQGFELGNFLEDSFIFPNQSALEDSIIPSSQQNTYLQFLPYNVKFNVSLLRESGISYGFEVDHWARMKMISNIRFQLGYLLRRNFKLNSEFTFGGYQSFKTGFWLEWEINYSWYWKIGTHHFIDNFDNNGLGRSIFINLKRDIR